MFAPLVRWTAVCHGVLQPCWLGGRTLVLAVVQKTGLRSLSHPTLRLFIAQVHLKTNDLCVFFAGRDVQVFDQFAHRAYFLGQRLSCNLDLVKLKLLHLAVLMGFCWHLWHMLVLLTKGLLSCVIVVLLIGPSFIQEFG